MLSQDTGKLHKLTEAFKEHQDYSSPQPSVAADVFKVHQSLFFSFISAFRSVAFVNDFSVDCHVGRSWVDLASLSDVSTFENEKEGSHSRQGESTSSDLQEADAWEQKPEAFDFTYTTELAAAPMLLSNGRSET